MKKFVLKSAYLSILFCAAQLAVTAQTITPTQTAAEEWMRVQTDDGEFSIEIPATYNYISDADGFHISNNGTDLSLRNMQVVTAYFERTLISFEIYNAGKTALDRIYESDEGRKDIVKKDRVKQDGFTIKRIESKTDDFFAVRKYFNSKSKIYVLTAASRTEETEAMARFFDSMKFIPKGDGPSVSGTPLSALKRSEVAIEMQPASIPAKRNAGNTPPDPNIKKPVFVFKPRAHYVGAARANNVRGSIRLRGTFSKDGSIPKIKILTTLPHGLVRQAIFALLRAKFLPKEVNGVPEATEQTLEYTFDIY